MYALELKVSASKWAMPALSLTLIGMLLLFYAVVNEATKVGESRRKAIAAQATAVLYCNTLPRWSDTRACVKELSAKGTAEAPTMFAAQ